MKDTIKIKENRILLQGFDEMDKLFVIHFLSSNRFSFMGRQVSQEDAVFSIHNNEIKSQELANFFREISPTSTIVCAHIHDFYLPLDTLPIKKRSVLRKIPDII